MDKMQHSIIKRVAFIGNYLPRQCGIATLTTDLCESVADEYKAHHALLFRLMIQKKATNNHRGYGLSWLRRISNPIAARPIS